MKAPSTSMFGLLARNAATGILIRRGPSSHTQLIKWNLAKDTFEEGQWFKGRIYERRCDISPNGTLLIYFAATYKEPLRSWTAISKPPWFTALALWPKGDGWNGGGRFLDSYSIQLNHLPNEATPHPDFVSGCRKFRVAAWADDRGEDNTVWHALLNRGQWKFAQRGVWSEYEETKGIAWKALKPEVWRKPHPKVNIQLEMAIEAIGHRNFRWYYVNYRLLDAALAERLNLGVLDWAEWDSEGDLLYAKGGCLFRQGVSARKVSVPRQLADFSSNRFKAIPAPPAATKL